MYVELLRDMVAPSRQNTVSVSNQITLLIPYYISSGLVTLIKDIDAPLQVPDIFFLSYFLVSGSYFRQSLFLFVKCLLASGLTLFRLSTLLWLGSCEECILYRFL
jgi:hypothetical protein